MLGMLTDPIPPTSPTSSPYQQQPDPLFQYAHYWSLFVTTGLTPTDPPLTLGNFVHPPILEKLTQVTTTTPQTPSASLHLAPEMPLHAKLLLWTETRETFHLEYVSYKGQLEVLLSQSRAGRGDPYGVHIAEARRLVEFRLDRCRWMEEAWCLVARALQQVMDKPRVRGDDDAESDAVEMDVLNAGGRKEKDWDFEFLGKLMNEDALRELLKLGLESRGRLGDLVMVLGGVGATGAAAVMEGVTGVVTGGVMKGGASAGAGAIGEGVAVGSGMTGMGVAAAGAAVLTVVAVAAVAGYVYVQSQRQKQLNEGGVIGLDFSEYGLEKEVWLMVMKVLNEVERGDPAVVAASKIDNLFKVYEEKFSWDLVEKRRVIDVRFLEMKDVKVDAEDTQSVVKSWVNVVAANQKLMHTIVSKLKGRARNVSGCSFMEHSLVEEYRFFPVTASCCGYFSTSGAKRCVNCNHYFHDSPGNKPCLIAARAILCKDLMQNPEQSQERNSVKVYFYDDKSFPVVDWNRLPNPYKHEAVKLSAAIYSARDREALGVVTEFIKEDNIILGGALAHTMHLLCLLTKFESTSLPIISIGFGSPPPFGKKTIAFFEEHKLQGRFITFCNQGDPVPMAFKAVEYFEQQLSTTTAISPDFKTALNIATFIPKVMSQAYAYLGTFVFFDASVRNLMASGEQAVLWNHEAVNKDEPQSPQSPPSSQSPKAQRRQSGGAQGSMVPISTGTAPPPLPVPMSASAPAATPTANLAGRDPVALGPAQSKALLSGPNRRVQPIAQMYTPPATDRFLQLGDEVSLVSDHGGMLFADGQVKKRAYVLDNWNPRLASMGDQMKSVFRIEPQMAYREHKAFRQATIHEVDDDLFFQDILQRPVATKDGFDLAHVEQLKQSAMLEAYSNEMDFLRLRGTTGTSVYKNLAFLMFKIIAVIYGSLVQLYNMHTKSYLSVNSRETCYNEPTAMPIEMEKNLRRECLFRIMPKFRIRADGEPVRVGDVVVFRSVATEAHLNHAKFKFNNDTAMIPMTGQEYFESPSKIPTTLDIREACVSMPHHDERKIQLLEYHFDPLNPQDGSSCLSLWQVEVATDAMNGEAVEWGSLIRLRHAASNMYLRVRSEYEVSGENGESAGVLVDLTCVPGPPANEAPETNRESAGDMNAARSGGLEKDPTVFVFGQVNAETVSSVHAGAYLRIQHYATGTWLHPVRARGGDAYAPRVQRPGVVESVADKMSYFVVASYENHMDD
ncbi:hypothetical protein HDU99_005115, partial [Rhizoclosmatium hyalinum]